METTELSFGTVGKACQETSEKESIQVVKECVSNTASPVCTLADPPSVKVKEVVDLEEPDEWRRSSPVLREPWGETPLGYSTFPPGVRLKKLQR